MTRPEADDLARRLTQAAEVLAAEFPAYDVTTKRTYQGLGLAAVRRDRRAQPGLYAVITCDPAEMRRELARIQNPAEPSRAAT